MNHVPVCAFLMLVFCSSGKGQNKGDFTNDHFNPETIEVVTSNVPATITRTIMQDSNGNIWIAAYDGLYRYDGKSFTNIAGKEISARFFSVLEDSKGIVWISTVGSGVYSYDGKSIRNFTTRDGLANDRTSCIYEDKSGNIWFGTDNGASCYDGKSFRNYLMNEAVPHDDNDVNSIIEDKTGKFWFGTRGKAYIYDGKTFTSLPYKDRYFTNVRSIIEDKKGNIWLGGNRGLCRYDGSTFTNFSEDFIANIHEDKIGNILTSSHHTNSIWALCRYDEKSGFKKKTTITETRSMYEGNKGMIFWIFEAADGRIWFGDLDGLHRYDGNTITDFIAKVVQE